MDRSLAAAITGIAVIVAAYVGGYFQHKSEDSEAVGGGTQTSRRWLVAFSVGSVLLVAGGAFVYCVVASSSSGGGNTTTLEAGIRLDQPTAIEEANSQWRALDGEVNLGVGDADELGDQWYVYAVLFDKPYSDYLEALQVALDGQLNNLKGSFSDAEPPGLLESPRVELTRSSEANC